jgi:hypothetical protein
MSAWDPVGGEKIPYGIHWNSSECNRPLMLPSNLCISKFGKGSYRADCGFSTGHFNNIYIIFQPSGMLIPASVPNATETIFFVGNQKMIWRTYPTVVEGHAVIRKEVLMPNILPRDGNDKDSAFIWMRIDGSQSAIDKLTPVAEGILQDAMKT